MWKGPLPAGLQEACGKHKRTHGPVANSVEKGRAWSLAAGVILAVAVVGQGDAAAPLGAIRRERRGHLGVGRGLSAVELADAIHFTVGDRHPPMDERCKKLLPRSRQRQGRRLSSRPVREYRNHLDGWRCERCCRKPQSRRVVPHRACQHKTLPPRSTLSPNGVGILIARHFARCRRPLHWASPIDA